MECFFVLCTCVEGEWNISILRPNGSRRVVKGQMAHRHVEDYSSLLYCAAYHCLRHATMNRDSVDGGVGLVCSVVHNYVLVKTLL